MKCNEKKMKIALTNLKIINLQIGKKYTFISMRESKTVNIPFIKIVIHTKYRKNTAVKNKKKICINF